MDFFVFCQLPWPFRNYFWKNDQKKKGKFFYIPSLWLVNIQKWQKNDFFSNKTEIVFIRERQPWPIRLSLTAYVATIQKPLHFNLYIEKCFSLNDRAVIYPKILMKVLTYLHLITKTWARNSSMVATTVSIASQNRFQILLEWKKGDLGWKLRWNQYIQHPCFRLELVAYFLGFLKI